MKQRIVTGIIAGAAFLVLLYLGDYAFHALLWIMALIGFDELVKISKVKRSGVTAIIGYIGVALLVLPWHQGELPLGIEAETWIWLWMLLLMSGMVASKNDTPIQKSSILLFGVIYIGLGFHYMALTRWQEDGLFFTLLLFICIWVTDSGAYFTGWLIGKTPLWPTISPKKTVEGAIGGLFLSAVAAICFSLYRPEIIGYIDAAILGLAIGVVGQIGDLIQSAYKRTFEVKDSGALLPGHGGVLDRCDSWLIVFPFAHLITNIMV
jgi:phosphatidate cytidylyltransferase